MRSEIEQAVQLLQRGDDGALEQARCVSCCLRSTDAVASAQARCSHMKERRLRRVSTQDHSVEEAWQGVPQDVSASDDEARSLNSADQS